MPSSAVVQRGEQDPLVEIRRRARNRKGAKQPQDPGAATDLRGAGRAALDVGGQPGCVARMELIEQERIDQRSGARAIQGVANMRLRHISYMTRPGQKVAGRPLTAGKIGTLKGTRRAG